MASWLVLDWDHDQFHVLCAQSSRRGVQVTRAVSWAHPEPFTPSTADRVGKALRDFLKTAKIAVAPVIVGLGRDRVFLKELRFPAIAAHEEANLVRFQTGKEMAEAVDNYAIDYVQLNTGKGEQQVMTVAGRRDIISMLQTLCTSAGLKLHAVTPKLFGVPYALARAVQPGPSPLTPKQLNVVLSVGQRWAELCFFKGDRLLQAQALANGPMLVNEVKRNLAVFQAQYAVSLDLDGPDCLYVFGNEETAVQSLQNGQHLPIRMLDPLKDEPEASAEAKNPGYFAGAVGLAALWSQTGIRPVNLFTPKRQTAPTSVTRQRGVVYGATAALAACVLSGIMVYVLADKRASIRQLAAQKTDQQARLAKNAQEQIDLDAYRDWEQTTVPWLDEMYDLTARFPYKEGFRVNTLTAIPATPSGAKKNPKDKTIGAISLTGITPKESDNVNDLHASMARDPHVRSSIGGFIGSQTGTAPQTYSMKIEFTKQEPRKYDTHLTVPPRLVAAAAAKAEPIPMPEEKKKIEPDAEAEGDGQ